VKKILVTVAWVLSLGLTPAANAEDNPAAAGFDGAGSDARAVAIADVVMHNLGGRGNWDAVQFDKFHVIAHANQAVDEVRRAEVRLGGAGVWEALRQSQWLWRKNPENLTEKEAARLAKIDQKSLRTAKAYQMRLVLQDIYRSVSATEARQRFRVWCRWVRWVARRQPKNLLRSMVKVAAMVENHLAGILAHWKWGVTNAFMEGLNSVFSATKRKARGYRSTTHLITMLYFVAGKLRFPQF
jgi:transposase